MSKIENIYTKDTMKNHKSWEDVYYYKACKIVFDKFKCVKILLTQSYYLLYIVKI